MAKRRGWTPDDDVRLRAQYADMPTADLARRLGRSPCSVSQRAAKLGLHKSAAYLASPAASRLRRGDNVGAAYRFPKGHVPANKGLRRPGWASGRMGDTQFRPGQAGWNWRPIGSERLVDGYRYTKVSDVRRVPWTHNWKPTHVLLWEAHHGRRVPRGHVLKFVNDHKTDVRLENLELIARRDLMARNTVHNLPRPVVEVVQLLGLVRRKINRRSRDEERAS